MRVARLTLAVASLAVACAAAAAPAEGQQPPRDTARYQLDSLRIDATRSGSAARAPFAISTVGAARISDTRAGIGLDEALAGVPGLLINNRQNFALGSRIVMRGLGARAAFGVRGVRILADGIPLTMPDGQSNLNNLDMGAAGSVQVLRGPASSLFGNAAGGVIAVESEAAPRAASLEARVVAGSQGRGDLGRLGRVHVKAGGAAGDNDYLFSASHLDATGFRDHSAARQTLVNVRLGRMLDTSSRLALTINGVDAPRAQNPGALPVDSMRARPEMAWARNVATHSGEATRQVQAGLRWTRTGATRADATVYALVRSLENPLPFAFIELDRRAGGLRALVERGAVTAGVDAEAQRDARREFENAGGAPAGAARRDQHDRVASIGPFAQVRTARGALGVSAGARYDAVHFAVDDLRGVEPNSSGSRTLSAPSGTVGATYALGTAMLFANVATGFQTPTTTELLNAPPAPGQPCCPTGFNTSLEPQRALSVEAGGRGARGGWSWDVALYQMSVHDALVPFQVAGVEGREFFRNAGRTRHRGVEAAARGPLDHRLSAELAYTFTDVRFTDDGAGGAANGNRVPGIPGHRLFGALQLGGRGSLLRLEGQHHSAQYTNDANTARADAYTLIDVRAQVRAALGSVEFSPFVAMENLLDRHYAASVTVNAAAGRFFEPGPGRSLLLGASVRTGAWRRQ
ncbi:MAG TPA: TonB-dependent receptor [Longimicrobiales bacterium]|nr:TonB-dependent receptor [Longimicrobiales bacterium]